MFDSIIDAGAELDFANVLICTLAALVLGSILSLVYKKAEKEYTRNYLVSLVLMPVVVCAVISVVNGNLGTGIAVLGAFSLIRFRSQPGNAKEITVLFTAMVIGLISASGYLLYAAAFTLIVIGILTVMSAVRFSGSPELCKNLKITIPEDLNYEDVFEDIFEKYTESHVLNRVKTTNFGSMYELRYTVVLKKNVKEKEMIDSLRTRNANLPIICEKESSGVTDL